MRTLYAQKTAKQAMMAVTKEELTNLKKLNPFISISDHDKDHHINKEGVIGYVAGQIDQLQLTGTEHEPIAQTPDAWFINKEFFNKNYVEVN